MCFEGIIVQSEAASDNWSLFWKLLLSIIYLLVYLSAVLCTDDEEGPESDDEEEEEDNDVSPPRSPLDTDKLMILPSQYIPMYTIIQHIYRSI